MSTPVSIVNVCSGVRLDNSYNHTVYFDSKSEQAAWFHSKVKKTFNAYTYLRKNYSIKVESTMQEADDWTYLFFTNGFKTYYYFINKIEYVNDHTVELFIELDVMQTYLKDYELLPCFVEREHVEDDSIGTSAALTDEGLDVGEYVSINDMAVQLKDFYIMILATANPEIAGDLGEIVPERGASYDSVFCGLGAYCVKASDANALKTILNKLDNKGLTDTILAMWMYPRDLISANFGSVTTVGEVTKSTKMLVMSGTNEVLDGGYAPRNKKLMHYPYNYLYVSNNAGSSAVYPYEFFGDPNDPHFEVVGSVSPDGGVRMYPLNFKGSQRNFESGLSLLNYPTCAWDSDVYKMWLAQNQNQMALGATTNALKIGAGVVTGVAGLATGNVMMALGGVGAAYSGVIGVQDMLAQKADKEIQPPQARGNYSATVNMSAGFQTFTMKKMCVSRHTAIRLDRYFDIYGYARKTVKIPNQHVRENWTYTKTMGCCISGDIVNEDRIKIQSIYDKGITFWVNGNSIGNYNLSNYTINGGSE